MKVNIYSFVKGANHGQFFQALGLKDLVESIVPDADVRHVYNNNHSFSEIKGHLKGLSIHKYVAFQYWWNKYLNFSSHESPDVEIYGSDMIWFPQSKIFPFDISFFGETTCKFRISYAPSAGPVTSDFYKEDVVKGLSGFSFISVRDENTKNFVIRHIEIKPKIVIDPSFFMKKSWGDNNSHIKINLSKNAIIYSSNDQDLLKNIAIDLVSNGLINSYKFFITFKFELFKYIFIFFQYSQQILIIILIPF